jgi:type IV secretory pathway VirB6-like protein
MDCVLTEFIGWNAKNANGEWQKVPLLFGMFTHAINSGAGGAFIALLVFMSIYGLVISLMRVAFIYILSMMGLILLFMIAPIIIPMMLFPQTKPMFDGWWKTIVSMVMQPVILFAYLSFMLSIYVEILEGPEGLKAVFLQADPSYQVGAVKHQGTDTSITSVFTMFKNKQDNVPMEPQLVFNLLSIFVISYLLSSFTNFVGAMGKELAGSALSPDLSALTPSFLNRGIM